MQVLFRMYFVSVCQEEWGGCLNHGCSWIRMEVCWEGVDEGSREKDRGDMWVAR